MKTKRYVNNKPFQKPKKNNPMVKQQEIEKKIKERMFKARDAGVEYGSIATTLLFVHILYGDNILNKDEIKHAIKKLMTVSNFGSGELKTIPDIIKYMKEEFNYSISEDTLIDLYPAIEGYLEPEKPESEE